MSFFTNFRFRSSKRGKQAPGSNLYKTTSHNSSQSSLPLPARSTQASKRQSSSTPLFLQATYVRAALVKGSFQTIVELPKYIDLNEWLALNVFEFDAYLRKFYTMLSEFVTVEAFPTMNAGPGFDYLWIDASKQPVKLPAATYIDYTLAWISAKFDDQSLFPTRQGIPFPANFGSVVKSIYVQMFRIFAHIYHNHFDKIVHLSLEPHWNSFFCHFISFGKTFSLIDGNEVAPLLPLIQSFEAQNKIV